MKAEKNCSVEPKQIEELQLDFCRTKAGIKDPQDDKNLEGAGDGAHNNAAVQATAMEPVEADWDSDRDKEFVLLSSTFNEIDRLSY